MTRTAVVTGGSRGLGLALTDALTREGWTVVTDARDGGRLREALQGLEFGHLALPVPGSVADPAHRAALADTVEAVGGLDLLVHNAGDLGVTPLPRLAAYPLDGLRALLDAAVVAPLALTQLLLPALRRSGGAVVAVSSDAAREAYPGWGGYSAGKAATDQWLAVLGAEEPAVRAWSVDPGDLRTDLHQQAFPGEDISDRPLPETAVPAFLRLLRERPPSGRYVASELAAVAGVTA